MNQNQLISLASADWQLNETALKQLKTKEFNNVIACLYESENQKADLSNNSPSLRIVNQTLNIEGTLSSITGELFVLLAAVSSGIDVYFENKPDLNAFKFLDQVNGCVIIPNSEKVFPPLNWIVPSEEKDYAETLLRIQTGTSSKIVARNALRDMLRDYFPKISVIDSKTEVSRDIRPCTQQTFASKVQLLVSNLKAKKKIQLEKINAATSVSEEFSEPCIAIKLANITPDGDVVLEEEGMKFLRGLNTPLFAMSVIGPARSGKSSLLSFLYGDDHAFKISPLVRPETRGFWIAVKEFMFADKKTKGGLLLIDTEGLYDPDHGPAMAKAIARLSFLLSNLVVFNSKAVYDQNDLQVLSEGCSYLVSKQATFPDLKIVVRNCSLKDKPLMISQIPSIPPRHQKALREVNKNSDQICTALFSAPTVEGGNVKLEGSTPKFQKEFAEFQSRVYTAIGEHLKKGRLVSSKDLVAKVQQCVREVNNTKNRSVDELLDEYEMQMKVTAFKTRISSLSHLEFEAKAVEILSIVIKELKSINPHQSSSMEVECRRFYDENRTVAIKKLAEEMKNSMTYVEKATTSNEMKQHWKLFEARFRGQSKFGDYKLQYENLLKSLEVKEKNDRIAEETRKKLEQLRIDEERKRREAEQREAFLREQAEELRRKQAAELAERHRIEEDEENRRREALLVQQREIERQRQERKERKREKRLLKDLMKLAGYSSSSSSSRHCSICGDTDHDRRTCPYR